MRKKAILLFLFSLILLGCPSPEIMPEAALRISMQNDPVIFSYDNISNSWSCSNCVIITETNGVSGYVDNINLAFLSGDETLEPFKSKDYSGKHFSGWESWDVCDTHFSVYEYLGIIVRVRGKDENGYEIKVQKYFEAHYQ